MPVYIEISLHQLKQITEEFVDCKKQLQMDCLRIMEIEKKMEKFPYEKTAVVCRRLKKQTEELFLEIQKMKKLEIALKKIIFLYENCEEDILNFSDDNQSKWKEYLVLHDLNHTKDLMDQYGIRIR